MNDFTFSTTALSGKRVKKSGDPSPGTALNRKPYTAQIAPYATTPAAIKIAQSENNFARRVAIDRDGVKSASSQGSRLNIFIIPSISQMSISAIKECFVTTARPKSKAASDPSSQVNRWSARQKK